MNYIYVPSRDPRPTTVGLSKRIKEHLEVMDLSVHVDGRTWTIIGMYLPANGTPWPGIRVLLQDAKGFKTFLLQDEAELLLECAKPGSFCAWSGRNYHSVGSNLWRGPFVDTEGMADLVYDAEVLSRVDKNGYPIKASLGTEVEIRAHLGTENKDWIFRYELTETIPVEARCSLDGVLERWRRMPSPSSVLVQWGRV